MYLKFIRIRIMRTPPSFRTSYASVHTLLAYYIPAKIPHFPRLSSFYFKDPPLLSQANDRTESKKPSETSQSRMTTQRAAPSPSSSAISIVSWDPRADDFYPWALRQRYLITLYLLLYLMAARFSSCRDGGAFKLWRLIVQTRKPTSVNSSM